MDRDASRIARAIEFLAEHYTAQPGLAEAAARVGLSPAHFQRVFTRMVGVSPKRFVQHLTLGDAKRRLRAGEPLLRASLAVGLSGPSRLHDLFVTAEAMTPGDYKRGGAGIDVRYGVHTTPFGAVVAAVTGRGLCGLRFVAEGGVEAALGALGAAWTRARVRESADDTAPVVERIFAPARSSSVAPLPVLLRGTPFQLKVWEALLALPVGATTTYGALAGAVGRPAAARAVGAAVGANPVAVLVPCHRVLRRLGAIGGYRWGPARKRALLAWEAARSEPAGEKVGRADSTGPRAPEMWDVIPFVSRES